MGQGRVKKVAMSRFEALLMKSAGHGAAVVLAWAMGLSAERSLSASSAQAMETRLAPIRDDSQTDPAFAQFKARLMAAARTGDVQSLLTLMSASVEVSSDPADRESVLARAGVGPGRPWYALRDALELGVLKQGSVFVAPYTHGLNLGPDDAVIVGRGVRLRSAPSAESSVVQVLDRLEIVSLDRTELYDGELVERSERPSGRSAWARVRTSAGNLGYVYGRLLVSSENTRFVFSRVEGSWRLTALSAGAG